VGARILDKLKEKIRDEIKQNYPELENFDFLQDLRFNSTPEQAQGDIGLGCFPFAKIYRTSPAKISEKLAANLKLPDFIESVHSEGPYLNFTFSNLWFFQHTLEQILEEGGNYGNSSRLRNQKIMVEYSAPNTNKPQHLGHVRNNSLGMSISFLLEKEGANIIRVNLVNDRGVHICKSMIAYKHWGNGCTPKQKGIKGDHFVGDYYVLFEKKVKEDPSLLDEVYTCLQRWEMGDKPTVELWRRMNGWVYDGFDETYKRLGCKFDKIYYESNTYKLGKVIVNEGLEKGYCRKNEKGEIFIDLSDKGLGEKVLLRADGTSIYITQDIGTAKLKFDDYRMDKSIYVVATEQNYHFQVLFETLKRFQMPFAEKCYHLGYGMVYLPAGKMKSREGTVVDADCLMDELARLAKKEINARNRDITGEDLIEVSDKIGLGALKYYILRVHPQKDINFSPEESINFDGATGPYLQYTHARISSLLRNSDMQPGESPDYALLGNSEEHAILRQFNKFYNRHSVLNAKNRSLILGRTILSKATGIVIKEGLRLLGIDALERM